MIKILSSEQIGFGLLVADISVETQHGGSAYQWPKTRPISDLELRPIGDQNGQLTSLRQLYSFRPISDRPEQSSSCLIAVHQRTPLRPISDQRSAYQMPNPRPISDPTFGLSVPLDTNFCKQHTHYSLILYSLTRARDLNVQLTLLTTQPDQSAGSKGGF